MRRVGLLLALLALSACVADVEAAGRRGRRSVPGAASTPDAGTETRETVVYYGQSPALGAPSGAGTALSTSQPYSLRRYAYSGTGVNGLTGGSLADGVLKEDRDEKNGTGATKVEQPTTAAMAEAVYLGGLDPDSYAIMCGYSGAPFSVVKKGGDGTEIGVADPNLWECAHNSVDGLDAALGPATEVVTDIVYTQCEADQYYRHTQAYAGYMATLRADAQTDFADTITAQAPAIRLLQTQCTSATAYDMEHNLMAQAQLDAADADPTHTFVVGPRSYNKAKYDSKHLLNSAYRELGEENGVALADLNLGRGWTPLRPSTYAASGSDITITYAGCTSPLVLDSTTVSTTNLDNHGFRLYEAGGRTITNVAVSGCTVTLTLSGTVYSGTQFAYAYGCPNSSNCAGTDHGNVTGMRGTVRDSSCRPSWHGGSCINKFAVAHGPLTVTGGASSPPLTVTTSIDLDGTADELSRADENDLDVASNKFGIAAWVYVEDWTNQLAIASKSTNADCSWGLYIGTNGRISFSVCSAAGDDAGTNFAFSGTSASTSGITCTSQVCTVTATGHGFSNGDYVTISAITTALTVPQPISSVLTNSFVVTIAGAANGAMADGTGTALRSDVKTATWTLIGATYDGSNGTAGNRPKLYASGSPVPTQAVTGTPPATVRNSAAAWKVGRFRDGNDGATDANQRSFNGRISNVVYWSGATPSATAMSDLYNGGVPRSPIGIDSGAIDSNLRLWLRLGDGYKTSAGKTLGTPEGFSGRCTAIAGSALNKWCESGAAVGDPIPIEALADSIHNSAPSYSSLRFTVAGNPTFSTSHP